MEEDPHPSTPSPSGNTTPVSSGGMYDSPIFIYTPYPTSASPMATTHSDTQASAFNLTQASAHTSTQASANVSEMTSSNTDLGSQAPASQTNTNWASASELDLASSSMLDSPPAGTWDEQALFNCSDPLALCTPLSLEGFESEETVHRQSSPMTSSSRNVSPTVTTSPQPGPSKRPQFFYPMTSSILLDKPLPGHSSTSTLGPSSTLPSNSSHIIATPLAKIFPSCHLETIPSILPRTWEALPQRTPAKRRVRERATAEPMDTLSNDPQPPPPKKSTHTNTTSTSTLPPATIEQVNRRRLIRRQIYQLHQHHQTWNNKGVPECLKYDPKHVAFPKVLDLDFPALTTEVNDFVRNRVMESMTSTLRDLKAELQNLETAFSFDNFPTQTSASPSQPTRTQTLSLRVRELEAKLKQVTKNSPLPVPSKNVRRGSLRQHSTRPSQARPQLPSPRRRALLPTPLLSIPFPQTQTQQVHRQLGSTHFTVHLPTHQTTHQ